MWMRWLVLPFASLQAYIGHFCPRSEITCGNLWLTALPQLSVLTVSSSHQHGVTLYHTYILPSLSLGSHTMGFVDLCSVLRECLVHSKIFRLSESFWSSWWKICFMAEWLCSQHFTNGLSFSSYMVDTTIPIWIKKSLFWESSRNVAPLS